MTPAEMAETFAEFRARFAETSPTFADFQRDLLGLLARPVPRIMLEVGRSAGRRRALVEACALAILFGDRHRLEVLGEDRDRIWSEAEQLAADFLREVT